MLTFLQSFGYGSDVPFIFKLFSFIFVVMFVVKFISAKTIAELSDHQHRHFNNLGLSSQEFYSAIEAAVREKAYPNLTIGRVTFTEGNIISGSREYLRIARHHMVFDVCAAPFGKDFFVSWWVGETPDSMRQVVASIPWVGKAIERACYKKSMYLIDTEIMFRESINRIIEETIQGQTESKGWRNSIGERERMAVPVTPHI